MRKIHMTIDKTGNVNVKLEGYSGESCNSEKILKLEKALGIEQERKATAEAFSNEETIVENQYVS